MYKFLTAFVWKPKFLNVLIFLIFIFVSVLSFLYIRPDLKDRYTKTFHKTNAYFI